MAAEAPPRILVVDDRPASLYSTCRVLRAAGFTVLEAATGAEGVQKATTERIDLVVLDINLPDLNGYEVCRMIRSDPRALRMPVIYLSASFVDDLHKVRGYEAGADGYLTHPVESTVLVATVTAFLRTRAIELEREVLLMRERAARAEAERANRAKDEFLATLSHELRSPLNAIVGWAEVARRQCADRADVLEALAVISRNARFQAKLVSDLLDVSRITSGKLQIEPEAIDVVEVVNSAIDGTVGDATVKGIRIERALEARGCVVRGDPQRLQQIVLNLLGNAVKFSEKGATVEVRVARINGMVEIAVADKGKGIAPDVLPFVFDRFWQEDRSSRRSHGGLGLGLAIVKHLVEMHDGTVNAESPGEGEGATFRVHLPALGTSDVVPHKSPIHPATAVVSESLRGLRILVVDDDADARRWMTQLLTRAEAMVRSVPDVGRALSLLEDFTPQILVSDLAMPEQDGFDLVTYLRRNGYGPERLPAIAFTAFAGTEDRQRAIAAGFQAFLTKPVDPNELIATITTLVSR
jgi:signal transduction histidine kinase